jgi:hypothetical protein
VLVFSRKRNGLSRLAYQGLAGARWRELEETWADGRHTISVPSAPNSATWSTLGTGVNTINGTATARATGSANYFQSLRRIGYVSAATTNTQAGWRTNNGGSRVLWRGNAAGLGGFTSSLRFGISGYVAGMTLFAGLHTSGTPLTTDAPSAFTDCIGVGKDAADTNLQLIYNDSAGVATKVDLGVVFPANTQNTDVYDLRVSCYPNDTVLYWSLYRENTGDMVEGSVNTNIPSTTTFLTPTAVVNTAANAAAVAIDVFSAYMTAGI